MNPTLPTLRGQAEVNDTSPALSFMGRLGVMFSRLPFGWHSLPQAAQRVVTVLAERARHSRLMPDGLYEKFLLSDPEIMRALDRLAEEKDEHGFKVGRRCVQKGLKQLEDRGWIERVRQGGVRLIRFLVNFAKPKPKAGGRAASKGSSVSQPAAAPTVEKPPDPEPTLSPAEMRAQIEAAKAEVAATSSEPTRAAPRRRIDPSLGTAVPALSDPERIRRAEENRQRQLAMIAARKQARQHDNQVDQPAAPGPNEIARE